MKESHVSGAVVESQEPWWLVETLRGGGDLCNLSVVVVVEFKPFRAQLHEVDASVIGRCKLPVGVFGVVGVKVECDLVWLDFQGIMECMGNGGVGVGVGRK